MTKEIIKQIILDKLIDEFDIDINALDDNFTLSSLSDLNSKIDSLEIISFIISVEEHFEIDVQTSESKIVTINDLIDFIEQNIKK
jgi:acyl carrier protein